MIFLGIDPGLHGGLAFIDETGRIVALEVMPIMGKPATVDAGRLASILRGHNPDRVSLEKVGSRPGQGVTSMFTFGQSYGMVRGVVAALGIPLELVRPQAWQKGLGVVPGDDAKARTLAYVRMLWPEAAIVPPRCRVPHSGLVDALGISEWCRLRLVIERIA